MKLTEAHIDSALNQLEAQAIPDNHPAKVQLSELFGLSPAEIDELRAEGVI